ncbi:M23 family metallopeptidase [Mucilaginibacter phyllosphaerae]|uniref:M23 family metallopeptidase n=1 Tax=Mucilaginibacter phyllosphaerae TaxID=1812349 RepID=A0A4Y8A9S5_9SPHI|nr:M23 family metallopeptidase [Mucilaginibacter phyllosphaerae]MBB3969800.1 murein DD-endopeptidase MepM/ murein hydrolase activator NlpD [Mucilaginibacter phyllosphaerae]TEW65178.1 M23 family metallopeptidase [Mucilaginibacter phyllosphaerae]GGH17446.1 hypothetical protein GCM10007352_27600 [Mucilaginibacter phyllosphaerae]
MKKLLLIVTLIILANAASAQDAASICQKINELNNRVLHGTIKRADAAKQFKTLLSSLSEKLPLNDQASWTFPLKGYQANAIGGTHGNGYSAKGYNYLDGNKHSAHPAHDIFINDKNQDDLDDNTGKPVDVLAIADGIVVACTNNWETTSAWRGGKFIWVYHRSLHIFSYYAHNRAIFVQPGDEVKQGDKIAEVGRTGLNACKKRSPTHLHFSAFRLVDGLPVPFNPYQQLLSSTKR